MLLVSPARALGLYNRSWQHRQEWWPDLIRKWYDPVAIRHSARMTFEYRILGLVLLVITAWGLYSVLLNR
jgi:type VI protein secretion system component VasF